MAKGGVIGNLRINMGLDSAQFQAGLANASKSMDAMAKQAAAFGAKLGLAISGAAAGMGAFVKMTASSAAKTGDVADRLGVHVESLQELRHAAEMSGVAVQNFDVAFRRFIRRSSEAARGTGAAKDAFKELGVSLVDNQKRMRNTEDIFNDVADAMGKIKDPANKLRLAFKMFDTDGAAMVKMFENGSEGIKKFREQAQQLGIVLSEDAVRSSQRFNDSLSLIGKTAEGFKNRVFAGILPAFENLAARILDISMNGQVMDGVINAISGAMNLLARGIGFVLDNLDHLVDLFKVFVGAKIITYITAVGGAMLVLARTVGTAGKAMLLFSSITRVKLTTLAVLAGIIAKVTGTYDALLEKMKDVGRAVMDSLPEGMRTGIEDLGKKLKELTTDLDGTNSESAKLFASYIGWSKEAVDSFGKAGAGAKSAADKMKEMAAEAARIFEATRTPLEQFQARIALLNKMRETLDEATFSQDTYNRAVAQAQDAFTKAEEAGNKAKQTFEQIGQSIAWTFSSAFQGLIDGSKRVKDVLADLLKQLGSMLMNSAFQALFSGGKAGGGILGNLFGGFKIPGFATGTNYAPGGLAWVGERGPELVNLPRGSQVIPNHMLGAGGGGVNVPIEINIDATGADASGLARVEQQLGKLKAEIPSMVISNVRKAQQSNVKLG